MLPNITAVIKCLILIAPNSLNKDLNCLVIGVITRKNEKLSDILLDLEKLIQKISNRYPPPFFSFPWIIDHLTLIHCVGLRSTYLKNISSILISGKIIEYWWASTPPTKLFMEP
jgi:hypothetical protein